MTGKGFSTWPGDKSQQRRMTRSDASCNSLGGDLNWMTHQGDHLVDLVQINK